MMHNADNIHYVLFGLCVAAIALSTVRLHRLPSSLTVTPVKRMGCVDLMPVGCCVWVWVGPRGLLPCPGVLVVWCGGVLLSHTLSGAVPSPCQALASGFGMGPGVSPGPWPPQILGYRPGNRGFPPACGGSGTGQWTRCVLLLTDRARVRTVLPVRLRGALPGPAPHAPRACGCGLPLDH